jgi:hypothetical protein
LTLGEEKIDLKPGLTRKKKPISASIHAGSTADPTWQKAWRISSFKWKLWVGLILLAGIFTSLPFFFQFIEARNGYFFSDIFLEWLPAFNVSIPVFFLIWSCCLILMIRIFRDPTNMLVTLWAYNGVTLLRMVCIGLISLNPPAGLIPLADPITNQFYGAHFITHDLFFSGHTTTVFLIFLCLKKKTDRLYALFSSIILGILLLIQHVHYTVDVLAAPVFTYAVFRLALMFTKKENEAIISVKYS